MDIREHSARSSGADAGFTLVELLVVMIILGLIAAIAVPAFLNQAAKARDAAAKSAARTAENAAEVLATDNDGRYSGPNGVTVANLRRTEPTLDGASLSVSVVTDDGYKVTVLSTTGNTFSIERKAGGTFELTCGSPGSSGCPPGGHWGG